MKCKMLMENILKKKIYVAGSNGIQCDVIAENIWLEENIIKYIKYKAINEENTRNGKWRVNNYSIMKIRLVVTAMWPDICRMSI